MGPFPIDGFAMDDVQTTIGLHSLSLEERDEIPKQSIEEWIAEFKTLIKFICEDTPPKQQTGFYLWKSIRVRSQYAVAKSGLAMGSCA